MLQKYNFQDYSPLISLIFLHKLEEIFTVYSGAPRRAGRMCYFIETVGNKHLNTKLFKEIIWKVLADLLMSALEDIPLSMWLHLRSPQCSLYFLFV